MSKASLFLLNLNLISLLIFIYHKAHVFKSASGCAAFLANYDTTYSVRVTFGNMPYDLPPWSISILPDCRTERFNSAKVRKRILGYTIIGDHLRCWLAFGNRNPLPVSMVSYVIGSGVHM